jgi:GMP synthase (glutamine-hydrolysing)
VADRPVVIAVDGRSSSGKTTLARRLAAAIDDAVVVSTDDIAWYHAVLDWADLLRTGVLDPVRRGEAVHYRPPKWDERGRVGAIIVPAGTRVLVVEGVGVGRAELAPLFDASVFVQSDVDETARRHEQRVAAGELSPQGYRSWMAEEDPFVLQERVWSRATIVVCGTPTCTYDLEREVVVAERSPDGATSGRADVVRSAERHSARAAPFLLLSIRAQDAAADDEYAAMLRFSGLDERGLARLRLDRESLRDIDLDAWSGIILGGGPYTVSAPPDTKSVDERRAEADLLWLLDDVVARDFPFLGCCYGIGVLGRHIGATVDGTFAEPIGPVPVSLTAAGRADPLLRDLPEVFDAFVGHKEAITTLPADAVVLATSPNCPVQAFRVRRHVYATQFHPELDVDGICTRIEVYKHHGYFEPETADTLKEAMRHSQVVHPPAVLRAFVRRYVARG